MSTQHLTSAPAIGASMAGGIYAGTTTDKSGALYALVLLGDKPGKELPWAKAMAWAQGLGEGADLPTRVEAALIFANLRDKLAREWHWTNEEHEADASFAWFFDFSYGDQLSSLKGAAGACVAVRRLPLQSFSPFSDATRVAAENAGKLRQAAQALLAACDAADAALADVAATTAQVE